MNNIQHEIDRELNHMKLPVDFADNIMQTKSGFSKPFYKKLSAAAILLTGRIDSWNFSGCYIFFPLADYRK